MDVRVWTGSDDELRRAADVYAAVFAEPPYHDDPDRSRASFLDRVRNRRETRPDFRLVLALEEGAVIGLVFGTGIAEGDWWRDRIVPQLDARTRDDWFGDEAFVIEELAVAGAHRRRGIAQALMHALLDDVPYMTAVLSAYADAESAQLFYLRQGWTPFATGLRIGDSPELSLYGRRLRGPEPE